MVILILFQHHPIADKKRHMTESTIRLPHKHQLGVCVHYEAIIDVITFLLHNEYETTNIKQIILSIYNKSP